MRSATPPLRSGPPGDCAQRFAKKSAQEEESKIKSPVRHLASAVFSFSDKAKYMLRLNAYFDEVGHSSDQLFAGMAGYLARAKNWERFEEEWLRILRATGLPFKDDKPYIHMKEFAHSRGPFAGWKGEEEKRQRLVSELVRVIDDAELIPIGAVVPMAEYNKLSKVARRGFDDPYFLALQFCAKAAATSLVFHPDERVSMVFDDNKEMKGRVPSLHTALKKTFMFGSRIGALDFDSMVNRAPLQAADMLAYEYGGYCRHVCKNPDDAEPRGRFKMLFDIARKRCPIVLLKIYSADELAWYAQGMEEGARREDEEYARRKKKPQG